METYYTYRKSIKRFYKTTIMKCLKTIDINDTYSVENRLDSKETSIRN